MAQKELRKKYISYRFRFWIGYGALLAALIGLLTFAVLRTPGGISATEEASVLRSAALTISNPESFLVADLPYHTLQKLSISLLGLTPLSVKLPSAFIALAASIGLVLLLRRWLQPRTSVIAGAIAITSTPFIFLAQQGTPAIMTIFWPVAIILFAMWGAQQSKLRHIAPPILAVMLGLSLYTPLMGYVVLALGVGSILHPHVRYMTRRHVPRPVIGLSILLATLTVLPLLYTIWKTPLTVSEMFIAGGNWHIDYLHNLTQLGLRFGDILGSSIAQTGELAPYLTLATILMAGAGVFHLIKQYHSTQSYVLIAWFLLALPVAALNPQQPEILFVPLMLLTGVGVAFILESWYKLFPSNPYARAFALLPLAILIGGIMITGAARYFYLYHYNSGLASQSSHDLLLAHNELKNDDKKLIKFLVVSPQELPIYQRYIGTNKLNVQLSTESDLNKLTTSDRVRILATKQSELVKSSRIPERVIASRLMQSDSDRLYIYKNTVK